MANLLQTKTTLRTSHANRLDTIYNTTSSNSKYKILLNIICISDYYFLLKSVVSILKRSSESSDKSNPINFLLQEYKLEVVEVVVDSVMESIPLCHRYWNLQLGIVAGDEGSEEWA